MFVRQIGRVKLTKCDVLANKKWLRFMSQSDSIEETDEKPSPQLKEWRPKWDTKTKLATKLKIFDRGTRPSTDYIVILNQPWDLRPKTIAKWWERKKVDIEIHDQRFVKERHEILGSNLAAAHFLVHRGGKVKFCGQSEWVAKNEDDEYTLPDKYQLGYVVEAIDANGMNLYYEGFQNMQHLYDLKFLSLKGCNTIDDWCLDRISGQYPRLEHLDISDCKNVSERGLEALYKIHALKTLIVTNHHSSPAFDLTCMMLEDCNPNLKCEVRYPEQEKQVPTESQQT